jgi:hypothetical protein
MLNSKSQLCHESRVALARNYRRDEGRPFDIALQEEVSNRLKRLWPKAMVVSVKEKGLTEEVRYELRR